LRSETTVDQSGSNAMRSSDNWIPSTSRSTHTLNVDVFCGILLHHRYSGDFVIMAIDRLFQLADPRHLLVGQSPASNRTIAVPEPHQDPHRPCAPGSYFPTSDAHHGATVSCKSQLMAWRDRVSGHALKTDALTTTVTTTFRTPLNVLSTLAVPRCVF